MNKEKWLEDNGKEIEITEEYVIISKTAIQKRIEECEEVILELSDRNPTDWEEAKNKVLLKNKTELNLLREILSQSTPLIPELQKTWNSAYTDALSIDEETYKPLFFEDYISNLKLDI